MAMNLKKTYGYNKKMAQEGVWVDIGDGASIKVAKLGTIAYQNTVQRHARKYQALTRVGRLNAKEMVELTAGALADCILLDWKNILDENDNPLPYNRENAYKLLVEYEEFRNLVESYANDTDLFRDNVIDIESDSKNSLITSSGT